MGSDQQLNSGLLNFKHLAAQLTDVIDATDLGTFLQLDRSARKNLPRTHDCPLPTSTLTTALERIDNDVWRRYKVPPTERLAAQLIRELANGLALQVEDATTSQAIMYIWNHLVCQIVTGESPNIQTFAEFRIEYLYQILSEQMINASSMSQGQYPELVNQAITLNKESLRLRGKGIFCFIFGSYRQVEAHRQAATTPWASKLRYEDRFERAVNGMWKQDGKFLRSDDEVLSLITTIVSRINVRHARIEAISQQVRELFSLPHTSTIQVVLSSDNLHLHDVEKAEISFSRSSFIVEFVTDNA